MSKLILTESRHLLNGFLGQRAYLLFSDFDRSMGGTIWRGDTGAHARHAAIPSEISGNYDKAEDDNHGT